MTGITKDRFRAMLAAYGADPQRWPAAEREAAMRLMAAEPALAAELAEAAATDLLLDALPAPAPNPALRVRLKSIPDEAGLRWTDRLAALWPFGAPWRPAAGLVAAALVGVVVGFTAPQPIPFENADWDEGSTVLAYFDPVAAVAATASGVTSLEMLQ